MTPAKLILIALAAVLCAAPTASAANGRVDVMTRNLYLGSGLSGATNATSLQGLVNEAGTILRNVDANDFRIRARGLAAEITARKPHLVGLQEVALWRTAPCTNNPIPPSATTVRYDYLQLLMDELGSRYRVVIAQDEFDFEVYVNEDGNEQTAGAGCPFGSELNGRLTMRDVIIARRGVKTRNARGGSFEELLRVNPGGVPIDITRGWTATDARVPGAKPFRFVNTHFEAFDNQASNQTSTGRTVGTGEIRKAQAGELVADGGPANGRRVILVGDLNSDVRTPLEDGDELAHRLLLLDGFLERSTYKPLSCCLETELLAAGGDGRRSDFDHKVDHVMVNRRRIRLIRSRVTGLAPRNGFWNSDHAGVFSALRVR